MSLPTMKKEHFKLRKQTRYLTIHRIVEQKSWEMLAYEEQKRKEKQKIPKILRKRFLKYHLEQQRSREKFGRLRAKNRDDSIFTAKQWYYVLEKYPLKPRIEWSYQRVHKLSQRNERIAQELEEVLDCAERFSLILHFSDVYLNQIKKEIEKIQKIEKTRSKVRTNRETLLRSQSLAAMKIRIFFEQRNGMIFDVNRDVGLDENDGSITVKQIREILHSKVSIFSMDVQNNLLKKGWKNVKKRNIVHNCVVQETTNAAFNTIKHYLKTIRTRPAFIKIDCTIVDRKLWVNADQIRHFLKDPINTMCSLENVRMSSEDCENWQEDAAMIVDILAHEHIIAHPLLQPYAFLIDDYKVASKVSEEDLIKMYDESTILQIRLTKAAKTINMRCFVVKMDSVWTEMERRIRSFRNSLKMAIRRKFTTHLNKLLHDFRKFDRALQYRSIDPSMMLNNKSIVDLMLQNEIHSSVRQFVQVYDKVFEITQHIALDTTQLDTLLNIASLRLSLPQSINDHAHFFNKRISTFLHFVNKKQSKVTANVQKAMDKLKIVQTMGNPQEVENYLSQMAKLRPMLDNLIIEIEDLNKFEKAVDIQVSDVTKMKQFVGEIESMENLFLATSGYYKHVNSFFECRRTLVNIESSRLFIEQFTVQLSIFESSLTTHRAAKHFIAYARNEMDTFKKNFAVAEVMSCRRLLDAHWIRMSEIVGFDLTPYANSSIAQICELGLEAHLQQLKPIAFSAEREATSADQLHAIVTFWSHEPLEMRSYSQWKLSLAMRLRSLHTKVQNDNSLLKHMTNVEQVTDDSLPQWIEWTHRTETILKEWSETQEKWTRVANIFVTCRDTLQKEYELLRTCAKYWVKIEKNVLKDATIFRIIQLPHLPCWIDKIKNNVTIIISGVRGLLNDMRMINARLCLSSELHLLSLFSTTSIDVKLRLLLKECFPTLKRLCFNRRNQLELVDLNGEKMNIELTKETIEKLDPCELIKSIETAFASKLTEIVTCDRQDRSKVASKIGLNVGELMEVRVAIDPLFLSRIDKAYFIQHKSIQRQSLLTMDFAYSNETNKFIPKSLADNWCNGRIILLLGEMCVTRNFVIKLAGCLSSSLRIINSHSLVSLDLLDRLAQIMTMNNWFVLLENVDLLSSEAKFKLFSLLNNQKTPFSRLFLSSTEEIKTTLPRSIVIETLKNVSLNVDQHLQNDEKSSSSYIFDISTTTPVSSVRTGSIPTTRLTQQLPVPPSSPHAILVDKIGQQIRNREISGCIGSMAKTTLKEVLDQFAEKVIWLYTDVFTRSQLIESKSEFAASPSGLIFDILSSDTRSVGADSERSYHSTVSTGSINIQTIVVFYGYSEFWNMFPFLSPLFLKKDATSQQNPFLTLDDGSTYWPQENVQFILCIPDEEGYHVNTVNKFDIPYHTVSSTTKLEVTRCYRKEWQRKFAELFNKVSLLETMDELIDHVVTPMSMHFSAKFFIPSILFQVIYQDLTEVLPLCRTTSVNDTLRITVILATANFLAIFIDQRKSVEAQIMKCVQPIKSKLSIPIPEDVCNWKISFQDATKLVKWEDEPFCQSSIEKDSAIGDIMIVTPNIDRLLFYSIRLLTSGHNILVHGPPFSRKTMFVKMISKHFSHGDDIEFIWLDGKSRVGNLVAQKKFTDVIAICEKSHANKQIFVVIDRFSFTEPLLPIIEFFVDHKTYWNDGMLRTSDIQFRMIIVTDNEDYNWLQKTKALSSTFIGIGMPTTNFHDHKALVQSIIAANFSAKSFSSEYHHILESFSECIVEIVTQPYVKYLSPMALATRLAKSFFFAFPDNCPDPDALIRLFIHESARVIGDAIDPSNRAHFAHQFEHLIDSNFSTTMQTVLKSIISVEDGDDEDESKPIQIYDMFDIIYSEVDAHDVVDGLSYEPVVDRIQFQRSVENFLFEHHRNHPKDRVRLFVDWESACWVQRVMRVIRQASEHMILAAPPSSGRTQIVKAACVACNATMMHLQVDASSYDVFINRWEYAFNRAISIIANTNQHVVVLVHLDFCYEKVEPRWMEQIRLWIESPNTQHIISDEQLHNMGEQLIECEKNLATQMQTVGLRLPGQRMCKYLPVETLKDPSILRNVLEARILDALHVVFLVDPQFKSDFSWCTIFHLPVIEKSRILEKVKKIIADCKVEEAAEPIISTFAIVRSYFKSIGEALNDTVFSQIFEVADNFQIMYGQQKRELVTEGVRLKEALHTCEQIEKLAEIGKSVDINAVQKRIIEKEEILSKMNKERNMKMAKVAVLAENIRVKHRDLEAMRKEEEKLREMVETHLNGPQEECRKCVEELLKYSISDLKTLTKIQKPSIGIRLCCEMIRTIFEPQFQPKKNAAENWIDSQKFLLDKTFLIKVATCDAEKTLTVSQMKVLKKYVDRVEFNANRIEHESVVCASLCRWIGAFLELACTLRLMEEQNDEVKELKQQIELVEKKCEDEMKEKEQLNKDIELLSSHIRENEQTLTNDRRLCDYRLRSGDLLTVLEPYKQKWRNCQLRNEKLQREMIGNTILFSIYRSLLLCHDRSISQVAMGLCTAHLTSKHIDFDGTTVTPSNIISTIISNLRDSRRFCLFVHDEQDVVLKHLRTIIPSANCVDMTTLDWNDTLITSNLPRYVYSIVPTIFFNFQSCPPVEMYEILMKSEEKEVCYRGRPIELPEDILFVFVAKNLENVPDQLRKLMELIYVPATLDHIDETSAQLDRKSTELAMLLGEFTAADILESRDLTRKAMQYANI